MTVSSDRYIKALMEINLALTKGLQTSIALIENFERLTEEQRTSLVTQLKELLESSYNVYREKPTER